MTMDNGFTMPCEIVFEHDASPGASPKHQQMEEI